MGVLQYMVGLRVKVQVGWLTAWHAIWRTGGRLCIWHSLQACAALRSARLAMDAPQKLVDQKVVWAAGWREFRRRRHFWRSNRRAHVG